jgi:hypothetical protein
MSGTGELHATTMHVQHTQDASYPCIYPFKKLPQTYNFYSTLAAISKTW